MYICMHMYMYSLYRPPGGMRRSARIIISDGVNIAGRPRCDFPNIFESIDDWGEASTRPDPQGVGGLITQALRAFRQVVYISYIHKYDINI